MTGYKIQYGTVGHDCWGAREFSWDGDYDGVVYLSEDECQAELNALKKKHPYDMEFRIKTVEVKDFKEKEKAELKEYVENYDTEHKVALYWMRKIYPTMSSCDKEIAEHYFPELKESEDEGIKGAIIDYLKDNNLTEWAVWLENQDEQKPTWGLKPYAKKLLLRRK